MNISLRTLLVSWTIAIALAAGAFANGIAMAMPSREGAELSQIVICAAAMGETTITIDEHGNRVDPAREDCADLCPDCLGAGGLALLPTTMTLRQMPLPQRIDRMTDNQTRRDYARLRPSARAPPQKV